MRPSEIKERNAISKDASKVDVLFGYCYPSTYRAGMTGLALQIIYSSLNSRNDTACERYFRHQTYSPSKSVETGRDLRSNHIVGFTLTYEEDILNLIQMLEHGSIPALANERIESDPIVVVGGPVVTANPEPYVDFVDAFVIGDGDNVVHELVEAVRESQSRHDAILAMSQTGGVYVPTVMPDRVERIAISDLDALDYPVAQVMPVVPSGSKLEPVFGRSFLLEVTRGCGHSCKFCLVGHTCRPRRTRSIERLKELTVAGTAGTGSSKVSLIGSSLGDFGSLEEFACWIVDQDLEVSVPSLRADSCTEKLLSCLVTGGQRTFTIAPETGSQGLRQSMGKGLTDEDIEDAVKLAASAGYRSLKLYFIIGLPGETDEDVKDSVEMIRNLSRTSGMRTTAGVNPFIPKAQTRWQLEPQPPIETLRRRIRIIEAGLKGTKVNLETLDLRGARIQAALSIGGRNLGRVIHRAASYGGYGGWRRAGKEVGIPILDMASDPEHLSEGLPWAFLSK